MSLRATWPVEMTLRWAFAGLFASQRRLERALSVRPGVVVQIATCINAVRQKPDSFACQYPCTYADWRDDVVSPVRGPMAFAGTPGADELNRRAASVTCLSAQARARCGWGHPESHAGCTPRGAGAGAARACQDHESAMRTHCSTSSCGRCPANFFILHKHTNGVQCCGPAFFRCKRRGCLGIS